MQYFYCAVSAFCTVFLKGFQHQNVIGGQYKSAFWFSYLMAVADVITVSLVATNGLRMILPVGLGASLGIVLSMWLHRRFFGGNNV